MTAPYAIQQLSVPNVGPSGFIPAPTGADQFYKAAGDLAGVLQAIQQASQQSQIANRDMDIRQQLGTGELTQRAAELQQRTTEQQAEHQRLRQQNAFDRFKDASAMYPGFLGTDGGQALARDAGLDPAQLQRAQQTEMERRQKMRAQVLSKVPAAQRDGVSFLMDFGDLTGDKSMPAEVRADLYKQFAGGVGVEPQAVMRFYAGLRVGLTAGQAGAMAGVQLPPTIPGSFTMPHTSVPKARPKALMLTRAVSALDRQVGAADRVLQQERSNYGKRFRQFGGSFLDPTDADKVDQHMTTFTAQRFPRYDAWRQQAEGMRDQLLDLAGEETGLPSDAPGATSGNTNGGARGGLNFGIGPTFGIGPAPLGGYDTPQPPMGAAPASDANGAALDSLIDDALRGGGR